MNPKNSSLNLFNDSMNRKKAFFFSKKALKNCVKAFIELFEGINKIFEACFNLSKAPYDLLDH